MQTNFSNLYSQASYNNMDFKFKTSSGDEIDFSMYDNKSLEYVSEKNSRGSSQSLTLTHEYGYSFSYKGDGLDTKDLAELDEALKLISPQIDKFMKNVKNDDKIAGSDESITNLANNIKQILPQPKNDNHKNLIADNTIKIFDELLEQNRADKNLLNNTKKLFDRLFDTTNKLFVYA
ncbi:ATP/GTP-binding protein [Campylobacter sp. faydin G-24]|uniref:ATP/GTP-binding protein n=1 Tax=Campylobacter anatolicus TaxID=2829105 RepID=A0ABS5HHC7_9BACT|nr:ATP/GTP-binding protein [Campylobacter anatolicus]MBR8463517.1 ATP/GTP-binding protein [Campylobacter anatolicus]MBR8465128.1 ATP/GTP-binding protein [Campylobacter anatolicus]